MKIVLLVDADTVSQHDDEVVAENIDKIENDVALGLSSLGHTISIVPLRNSISLAIETILDKMPDIVFNMTEQYHGDRDRDAFVATMLEQVGLAFTGGSSRTLALCRDKSASKYLVERAGVHAPRHTIVRAGDYSDLDCVPLPCVVKPLRGDGGDLITRYAFAGDRPQLRRRAQHIQAVTGQAAIIEEYISGDEFSVTLTGVPDYSPKVWAVTELQISSSAPSPLVTSSAKSDRSYRKRHSILYAPISSEHPRYASLVEAATRCFTALGIEGYARLEFRVRQDQVYFIEANPNSSLDADSQSTPYHTFGYTSFLSEILRLGMYRVPEAAMRFMRTHGGM